MSDDKKTENAAKPVCGIVMPISAIDGLLASHWVDVRAILTETIENAGFHAHMVSDAEDVGVIHKRIIQNLYDNPIVVCDISGKNPNVMFELGMRLAFDKPTIIVKDDKTPYSFDTGAIEHLEYPRDLRFNLIVDFKEKLRAKIKATHTKATSDGSYTTFLKHFGEFTVAKLDKKEVSGQEFILEELRSMRAQLTRIQTSRSTELPGPKFLPKEADIRINIKDLKVPFAKAAEILASEPGVASVTRVAYGSSAFLEAWLNESITVDEFVQIRKRVDSLRLEKADVNLE